MIIRPKSKDDALSGSVLLVAALIIAIIMVTVYFVGAQFRNADGESDSDFPSGSDGGAEIEPVPDFDEPEPVPDGTQTEEDDVSDGESESEFESETETETETETVTETETETEMETETEPPETTTTPPETTTQPPETTTKPPETTTKPPETTTETTTKEDDPEPGPVESLPIYVDGTLVSSLEVTYVNGTAFVPVCGFATAVDDAEHSLRDNKDTAKVTAEGLSVTASVGDPYIIANGRALPLQKSGKPSVTVTLIDGNVAAPVAVLAKVFVSSVEEKEDGVYVSSSSAYIESGDEFYDAEELYLISHVVNLEAGYESFNGKLAVASVIMNRVAGSEFPDTVYSVVYQKNQFSVVDSSRFDDEPNADSLIAAKMILEGYRYDKRILFFDSTGDSWAAENRTFLYKLGGHYFYD